MNKDIMIKVEKLTKIYRLYDRPFDRVKESLNIKRKRYSKDFYALNDVSFEVNRGETIGVIGKNGAGKSTLLKILTGVLSPSSGIVTVNGRVASLLELGAGFNPEMTGIENIFMNGLIMGISRNEINAKLEDILSFADIGDFIYQPVKMYSSGMFARLAFAMNANVNPDILIVDEALSVGDIFFQNKCYKKFEEIKKSGVTIIFVSHDTGAVRRFCDRTLWLNSGETMMFAETDAVCEAYMNHNLSLSDRDNEKIVSQIKVDEFEKNQKEDSIIKFPKLFQAPNCNNKLSQRVEIVSFYVSNQNSEQVTVLDIDKYYNIHIIAKFNDNISNLIFGVTLETANNLSILAINSYLSEQKSITANKGEIIESKINFKVPRLHEGEYLLSPAIAYGTQLSHVNLTWLYSSQTVHINNNGYNVSLLEVATKTEINVYQPDQIELI